MSELMIFFYIWPYFKSELFNLNWVKLLRIIWLMTKVQTEKLNWELLYNLT